MATTNDENMSGFSVRADSPSVPSEGMTNDTASAVETDEVIRADAIAPSSDESESPASEATPIKTEEVTQPSNASKEPSKDAEPKKPATRRRKTAEAQDSEPKAAAPKADAPKAAEPLRDEDFPDVTLVPRDDPAEKAAAMPDDPSKVQTTGESRESARRRGGSAISRFARGEERVLTADGEERNSQSVERYSASLIDLSMSKKTGKILTDRLESIELFSGNRLAAVLYHGDFKVYIAADNLLAGRYAERALNERLISYNSVLNSRLGCMVSYIVTDIDIEGGYAAADHLRAARVQRRQFFVNNTRTGHPLVTEGRVVEANILAVRDTGIIVDIFGFEKFVPLSDLTYSRLATAAQEYAVGDRIEMKVLGVELNNNDVVDVNVSAKVLHSDPFKKALERCVPNSCHIGTVTRIDENAVFVTTEVNGVQITCYCRYPRRGVQIGSLVTIRVNGSDKNSMTLWGSIIRVNRI